MSNQSDGCLGVYCTVSLSWDLASRQNPLEYLKQWDLRRNIGHTGDERVRVRVRKPTENQDQCQQLPAPGRRATQKGGVTGLRGWGHLAKWKPQQAFWGHWSHGGATAAVGTGPKVERERKTPAFPFLPTPTLLPGSLSQAQAAITTKPAGVTLGTQGRGKRDLSP